MLATITGTGDGTAPVVTLSFPYIDKAHIKAVADGAPATFTWTGTNQVTLDAPVADGAEWRVYRETPTTPPIVDFTDGAVLSEAQLDLAQTVHRYREEELADGISLANVDLDGQAISLTDLTARMSSAEFSVSTALASIAAFNGIMGNQVITDAAFVVRPESYASSAQLTADATSALRSAIAAAGLTGARVQLTPGQTYTISSEVVVPAGVNISGPATAILKLKTQVATTLTSAITSGTGAKTFTVADASQFSVGQSVMFATVATDAVSPNDSFSHAGRQISAIAGNSVTIAGGPNVNAHASGDIMASTAHLLRLQGNNRLESFTVDGNEANQTYAHWITSAMLVQEGDNVTIFGLSVQNTPSDGFLIGGPSGGKIYGSWVINSRFLNIGNNGVHYGNVRQVYGLGNRFVGITKRFGRPVIQGGGGASGRGGHMDGAWIYSNDVGDGIFALNYVEDSIAGVGALGTDPSVPETNDDTIVANNTFLNCQFDVEITDATKRIIVIGNKASAEFPFAAVNGTAVTGGMRWVSHSLVSAGGNSAHGRIQNLIVAHNFVKNGNISLDRVVGFGVNGNVVDNRMMSGPTYNSTVNMGILLYNYEAGIVKGNITIGGAASLWLQNSNVIATASKDTIIEGNVFRQPYTRAVSGAVIAPGTMAGTVFRNNVIRADTAMKMEDGVTSVPVDGAGNWRGITLWPGLQVDHNEIWFNNAGAAAFASTGDTATDVARRWNKVNGVFELFNNFSNDSTAASGGVAVGGTYRNGSSIQQRVA